MHRIGLFPSECYHWNSLLVIADTPPAWSITSVSVFVASHPNVRVYRYFPLKDLIDDKLFLSVAYKSI